MNDIDFLAAFAYSTGQDPIDYAAENVVQSNVNAYLGIGQDFADDPRELPTAPLSRRIVGDLLDAGWKPPEVTR